MAGSIAGAASSPDSTVEAAASFFNGVAPGAKLVVDDLSRTSIIAVPDVDSHLLPHSYSAGAKLHSNSWNYNSVSYTQGTYDMDLFQRQHDDFLVLVSSANDGNYNNYRIKAPGTAKNVVTVGAIENSRESWSALGLAAMLLDAGAARLQATAVFPATFGPSFGSFITLPLVVWEGHCRFNDPDNVVDGSGAVILIRDDACLASSLCEIAQRMNAAACLIYERTGDATVMHGASWQPVTSPSGMRSLSAGNALITATLFGPVNVTIRLATASEGRHLSVRSLADFSVFGPTEDQRIKPDVLCPGHIITSASSDGSSTTNQVLHSLFSLSAALHLVIHTSF